MEIMVVIITHRKMVQIDSLVVEEEVPVLLVQLVDPVMLVMVVQDNRSLRSRHP
tara:strand:- start:952 stop:1113 length:162 start_codon:yes stop_codon:yes gene_type:complete